MQLELPIRTQHLELREFWETDCAALHAYRSDPDVTRFTFFGPDTVAETEEYLRYILETQLADPRLVWELAVVDADDSSVIGSCDLTLEDSREADLGYFLARPAWGKGRPGCASSPILFATNTRRVAGGILSCMP
ncbi:MAG: GNAT family N-acetyltransferase [Myxococcota bacterium]